MVHDLQADQWFPERWKQPGQQQQMSVLNKTIAGRRITLLLNEHLAELMNPGLFLIGQLVIDKIFPGVVMEISFQA